MIKTYRDSMVDRTTLIVDNTGIISIVFLTVKLKYKDILKNHLHSFVSKHENLAFAEKINIKYHYEIKVINIVHRLCKQSTISFVKYCSRGVQQEVCIYLLAKLCGGTLV